MSLKFKKIAASLLDVYVPVTIIIVIIKAIDYIANTDIVSDHFELLAAFMWGLILMKDIFGGQSIFKKALGLRIIEKNSSEPLVAVKSIIRNFVVILLVPIEAILYALNNRRIGDFIFNTEVIETDKKKLSGIKNDIQSLKALDYLKYLLVSFSLAFIGLVIYSGAFFSLFHRVFLNGE